jgi:hypothetical protein
MSLFTFSHGQAQPEPLTPANTPIITNSYAIEKGRYRDVLKIYIEADDPNGEMFRIATGVEQVVYGRYPIDWTQLKPQHQHHLIGHLQWNTSSPRAPLIREWTWITINVSVFDKAGNESNVVVFPFQIVSEVLPKSNPPALLDQRNIQRLGYISINLVEPTAGGGVEDTKNLARHLLSEPIGIPTFISGASVEIFFKTSLASVVMVATKI